MKTMNVTDFKAHALQVMGQVAETRESVVVTKHGRPLVEVRPASAADADFHLGDMADTLVSMGDVVSPAADPNEWEACR